MGSLKESCPSPCKLGSWNRDIELAQSLVAVLQRLVGRRGAVGYAGEVAAVLIRCSPLGKIMRVLAVVSGGGVNRFMLHGACSILCGEGVIMRFVAFPSMPAS